MLRCFLVPMRAVAMFIRADCGDTFAAYPFMVTAFTLAVMMLVRDLLDHTMLSPSVLQLPSV